MRISVVCGGYVGLVSAVCFSELGHRVKLIEIDAEGICW
jgi:UDPglucose 6-dehydrogenase